MEEIFLQGTLNYSKMDFRMALAWDEQCGILVSKMHPLVDGIVHALREKEYGTSMEQMWTVLTCRARDFKQRKQFKKDAKRFEYEILLDYFLIKNVDIDQKKSIIRRQIIEITEQTFSKYKFEDFNKAAFLSDVKTIVNSIDW
jgi:hypothetical protein